MKLCRYDDDRVGLVDGDSLIDVTPALDVLGEMRWPVPPGDRLVAQLDKFLAAATHVGPAARKPLFDVCLLSPIANPTKIIGAPVNYAKHLDEAREDRGIHHGSDVKTIDDYGLFLKATTSLVGPGEGIALRFPSRRNDHEVELVAVIGRTADRVSAADAMAHVAGFTIGLDMTVRGTEDRSFRKSIDSYSVIGPWLVTPDEIADPMNLDLALTVNGETRQRSNTRHLIFDLPRLIAYASSFYTLYPGDLIMTGTPEGVGPVVAGDRLAASIEGIGTMTVVVRAA